MIRRAICLVAAVASFGAAAATRALPADARATTPTHVGIVVRFSATSTLTACVTQGGSGLDVLVRGFPDTDIPTSGPYAGFVVSINGTGQNPPDDTHYWSYWHSTANGWKYSSTGGGSYTPKAGAVEGWSYVDGQANAPKPPVYGYQKLCGNKDPRPTPTTTKPSTQPSTHPTHRPTHGSTSTVAPTHAPTSTRPARTSAAPPKPRRSPSSPAPKHDDPTVHPSSRHHAVAKHPKPRPRPTTAAPHGSAAPTASNTAVAPVRSPAVRPTAQRESTSGFPAWGTVLAILVVAALGGTAWLRLRRRAE